MENFNQNVVEQNNSQYIPNSHYVAPEPDGGHKKRFGIVILVIILLLLLGGGVYGYFYKIADVNLEKVMSSFEKVNSVQFQIKANFDLIPKKN